MGLSRLSRAPTMAHSKIAAIDEWPDKASSDPAQIRKWWAANPDYNIGCCTTGLVVFDCDVKDGKHGIMSANGIGLKKTTLIVRTASGGLHYYYDTGANYANAVEILGPTSGLDIRAYNGYVLAPGSEIDGVPYVIENDVELEMVPEKVVPFLKPRGTRTRGEREYDDDSEEAIAQGRHYLIHNAPIAIENRHGDNTTIAVAAYLTRDIGLSVDTALDLMLEHWNGRCSPEWTESELRVKVENGEKYGQNAKGCESIANIDVEYVPTGDPEPSKAEEKPCRRFNLEPFESITFNPSNEWLIKHLLPKQGVGLLFGASGTFKSFKALDLSFHLAIGLPWAGRKVTQGTAVYIAAEGAGGVRKRVDGLRKTYEDQMKGKVPFHLISAAPNLGSGVSDLKELIASVESTGTRPAVITIDTVAQTMGGADENGSGMVQFINNATALANHFKCLVLLVHHCGLGDDKRERGHSSLPAGADVRILCERKEGFDSTMTVLKLKDEDGGAVFNTSMKRIILGHDEDGDEVSTLVVDSVCEEGKDAPDSDANTSKNEQDLRLLHAIKNAPRGTRSEWAEAAGVTVGSLSRRLERLKRGKLISKDLGVTALTPKGRQIAAAANQVQEDTTIFDVDYDVAKFIAMLESLEQGGCASLPGRGLVHTRRRYLPGTLMGAESARRGTSERWKRQ
jgi:AAA domain/Bifunctional DNA primase/polymerase, N-terminal